MKSRSFWLDRILESWKKAPIVWLSGVRRVGKTTLAGMIPDAIHLNCDLPSVHRTLAEPELFFEGLPKQSVLVFDEIHRLDNPSQVLKIGADVFSHLRILATGSSMLAATQKFSDSLTGRKRTIYLPPVLWTECTSSFGVSDFDRRLLHGGLPQRLLDDEMDEGFYSEWLDSYYARDIQELFNVRNRTGFMNLLMLVLRQSGNTMEISSLAKHTSLSRPTVMTYLEAMNIAHALFTLRPFHGGGRRELTRMPKIYAFDTGFVAHAHGWSELRNEDRGLLWEHLVLDTLRSLFPIGRLYYWRDKSKHEIDFVLTHPRSRRVDTIECKMNPDSFSPKNLLEFRRYYPEGEDMVLSPLVKTAYKRTFDACVVSFRSLRSLF